ncbi:MAG: cytochrome c biogenesis heme-transporting ATPase CcmA [Bermanella sp.]
MSRQNFHNLDASPNANGQLPMLSARGLLCERDERVLFCQLDFDLFAGDIVRIAGPNGAGKSSLMRILLGLSAGFEGQLFWHGQPMAEQIHDFRSQLLYLGHQLGVKGSLSAEENLAWFCPNARPDEIYAALQKVGLKGYEDLLTHALSAGQQRRVALARLFLADKPLWILDEPFTAIDKEGVSELEQVVIKHAQGGGLVILTTHHDLRVPVKTLMLGGQESEMPLC